MSNKNGLLNYICNFILRVRPEISRIEEIDVNNSLGNLGIESMDLVELQVLMMDDYGIDIFKYMNEKIMDISIKEFSGLLLND